ncbi:Glycosyl hydrolases family 16 [Mucilaginibacter xinganensis]|uniref:Glycosyl hydrolases family 16 n=2 Tax=Mucilaginibacter xinganensis TaxID=1234841 RepID=A0A223NQY9_9SPHI|nr:Glycosyl hydrolases family 16 [Mucilaginibacter xinganensis]
MPPDKKPVTPDTPVIYKLVWSDEFSGTAVDTSQWNMETGTGVNNEKEYYQAANATVENGNLVITAKQEFVGGASYTSARMNTLNKVSAKYGRIEARIKLPLGNGLWPAFWMMGSNIKALSWPNCGEIDIMEHINADDLIYGTIHWNGGGGHVQYGDKTTTATPGDYHLYAVEWNEKEIRWYVDDKQFVTANIAANINNTGAFHLPFFILLNLAVAGDFPGQTVDQGKLPAKMYVDYVRVYKAQ